MCNCASVTIYSHKVAVAMPLHVFYYINYITLYLCVYVIFDLYLKHMISAGAGLWGTSQPISNNSALIADSAGQIGIIYCHSASEQPHIGRWISPDGNNITFTSTDAFDVGLQSGSFIYSYTTLAIKNRYSLSGANQGVYSCQIPDENGIQNTLHIGLYPREYAGN